MSAFDFYTTSDRYVNYHNDNKKRSKSFGRVLTKKAMLFSANSLIA